MTTLHISIVVPCFNESEVIEAFHAALLSAIEPTRQTFEVCYVDDGSNDGTRSLLRGIAEVDPRIRFTAFSRNFGKEAALLAGLRMAQGRAVVMMDADLQHPPELLPRMFELHRQGFDQVVAQRDRAGEGAVRSTLSRAYYRLMRHCMDVDVMDGSGDFRLLSRRAVESVLSMPESNRFSKGIFSWIGFETVNITYHNCQRAAGTSKWGSRRLLNYGIDGLISFNSRPLRLAIYTGLWAVLCAFVFALWTVAKVALYGASAPGYATLLTAVVALGGLQLVTLGIIGEYVGRIYHETKRRPHYVIRETDQLRAARSPERPSSDSVGAHAESSEPKRQVVRQLFLFVAIGFVNTAVYFTVYMSLNGWIPYLAAHVLGYAVSVVGSFLLNTYITLRTKPTWQAFVRYPISSVAGLLAAGGLLYLAVSHLGMNENIAALTAGVLVTPLSFLLARWAITSGAASHDRARGELARAADESDAV
ncbi:glycosyltransferase [Streptomyces uncialis]|uniref:glycosyltransferase n=1 Tax=Streptomyces uncialis TaxID=1048205 RepID=UPI003867CCBD|nr:glycosyltransferase [Streptomyces uncialis]